MARFAWSAALVVLPAVLAMQPAPSRAQVVCEDGSTIAMSCASADPKHSEEWLSFFTACLGAQIGVGSGDAADHFMDAARLTVASAQSSELLPGELLVHQEFSAQVPDFPGPGIEWRPRARSVIRLRYIGDEKENVRFRVEVDQSGNGFDGREGYVQLGAWWPSLGTPLVGLDISEYETQFNDLLAAQLWDRYASGLRPNGATLQIASGSTFAEPMRCDSGHCTYELEVAMAPGTDQYGEIYLELATYQAYRPSLWEGFGVCYGCTQWNLMKTRVSVAPESLGLVEIAQCEPTLDARREQSRSANSLGSSR